MDACIFPPSLSLLTTNVSPPLRFERKTNNISLLEKKSNETNIEQTNPSTIVVLVKQLVGCESVTFAVKQQQQL